MPNLVLWLTVVSLFIGYVGFRDWRRSKRVRLEMQKTDAHLRQTEARLHEVTRAQRVRSTIPPDPSHHAATG